MKLLEHIAVNARLVERPASPPPATKDLAEPTKAPAGPAENWKPRDILYQESEQPAIINQLIEIMAFAGTSGVEPLIVQIDGILTRIVAGSRRGRGRKAEQARAYAVTVPYLRNFLTEICQFFTADRRKKGEGIKEIGCPKALAEALLAKTGEYGDVPVLNGLLPHPTILADGRILDREGLDRESGLFLDFGDRVFPAIPEKPSREEAEKGLSRCLDLFAEFPFKSGADHSVAVAFLLTALVRWALPVAPGFGIDATTRGTGKTWLVSVVSLALTGREPITLNFVNDEKEMSQRLFSILKTAGASIICVDNIGAPLKGDALCTVLTSPKMTNRVLGQSETQTVSTTATFAVTGNNLIIQGDSTTRFVMCQLDAKMEHPEDREFRRNGKQYALEYGPEIVAAGLTFLKGYIVAQNKPQVPPWRFSEWNALVRGALLWAGMADPLEKMRETEENDPERSSLRAVLKAWFEVFRDAPTPAKEALDPEIGGEGLGMAIENAVFSRGAVTPRSFGRWIMARRERRVDGLRFVKGGENRHGILWKTTQD